MTGTTHERVAELLVERALDGLPAEHQADFEHALSEMAGIDLDGYDRAAAAVHECMVSRGIEPIPAPLRDRLIADAGDFLGGSEAVVGSGPERPAPVSAFPLRRRLSPWAGWLAAAAALLLWVARPTGVRQLPPESERQRIAEFTDAMNVAWSPTADELAAGASGNIVWSNTAQQGYMRFENFSVNDREVQQYQLWIFDGERPNPVDGGVFDVPSDGVVLVPIDAKLLVHSPTLFAITLEPPGGVVVSKKERILFTAEVL